MRRSVTVALILAIAATARADDDLADARKLEAALEYDKALAIVERVLAAGAATDPTRYVELQLYAGRLAAGLDRVQVAEDHYARALAVKPDATLPDGTSPKLVAPLDTARRANVPLRISAITANGAVSFLVDADRLGIVRGIALTITDRGGARRELVEHGALRIAVPPGAAAIEVAALDAAGNRVWRDVPPLPIAPVVVPHVADERPGAAARSSTWAVATGVILGAGAFAAWRFNVAQHDWDRLRGEPGMHDYSQLVGVEDRGRRWGLTANIAFGVAALTGITSFVLYTRQRHGRVLVSATGVGGEF